MPEYALEPLPPSDRGPVVQAPHPCTGCGYNILGLPISGKCPECGKPVELSLMGELLRFASPAYVRSIDLGLTLVLTAIALYALLFIASFLIGAYTSAGRSFAGAQLAAQGLMLIPAVLFALGYWKYTAPDPGFTGREKPTSARAIARTAVCVQVACELGTFVLSAAAGLASGSTGAFRPLLILTVLIGLTHFAAWATLFFAVVLYTRWLARRVPDQAIVSTTRVYIWLLPLLETVGALACMVGPLVALVLYATLLNSMRQRTKETLDWQQRGGRHVFGP